jgi:hypothetical protein
LISPGPTSTTTPNKLFMRILFYLVGSPFRSFRG